MESDILRIKTDMDVLEKQLEELVKEESDLTKDQTMKVKYDLKDVNMYFKLFFFRSHHHHQVSIFHVLSVLFAQCY